MASRRRPGSSSRMRGGSPRCSRRVDGRRADRRGRNRLGAGARLRAVLGLRGLLLLAVGQERPHGRGVERRERRALEHEIVDAERIARRRRERLLHHGLELAQVARPRVFAQEGARIRVEAARRFAARARPRRRHLLGDLLDPIAALAQRRQPDLDRSERARERRLERGAGRVEGREPAQRRRAHPGRRPAFEPGRELALRARRECADLVEPDALTPHARVRAPEREQRALDLAHPGVGRAGDVRERAVGGAAEVVQIADQRAAPRAGLAAHEHGYIGEARIERAQELGQIEIGEPAREAGRRGLAPRALRERRPLCCGRPRRARDVVGARGVGEVIDRELVELRVGRVGLALLPDQHPVRLREPGPLAVGELELGLPVAREAEHHHVGGRCGIEDRVGRAPDHGIRAADEPDQRGARAVIAVDDPDGEHRGIRQVTTNRENSAQSACQTRECRRGPSPGSRSREELRGRAAQRGTGGAPGTRPRTAAGRGGIWAKVFHSRGWSKDPSRHEVRSRVGGRGEREQRVARGERGQHLRSR